MVLLGHQRAAGSGVGRDGTTDKIEDKGFFFQRSSPCLDKRATLDILTRDQLTIQIWGEAYAGETLGVAVYIRRIREKIEDNPSKPRYVQTVWREGYRFGD